jgi:hypothetical protein
MSCRSEMGTLESPCFIAGQAEMHTGEGVKRQGEGVKTPPHALPISVSAPPRTLPEFYRGLTTLAFWAIELTAMASRL